MWKSIKNGPYTPEGTSTGVGGQDIEARMRKVDDRALAMLKLGLSREILTKVSHHKTAKEMYDAIL